MTGKLYSLKKSYLTFNTQFLTIIGLWNPYNGTQKWLYHIYTILIPIILTSIRAIGFLKQGVMIRHDFTRSTLCLVHGVASSHGWIKTVNFVWNRSTVDLLIAILGEERIPRCSNETARYRNKITTHAIRVSKIFTFGWISMIVVCVPLFYTDELTKSNRTFDDLAISYSVTKNVIGTWNLRLLSLLDCVFTMHTCGAIISHDCFIFCLMYHIAGQLKIVNFRLGQCCSVDTDFPKTDMLQQSNVLNFECGLIYSKTSDVTPVQELTICIQHYQRIVRMVAIMNKVYGCILLPQLLTNLMTLSFAAIHIFVTKTVSLNQPGSALFVISVSISCIFQLSAYCWGGDNIIFESNRTSAAIYTCTWYRGSPEFRTNLKIFISMSQKALVVSAFGLFDLSLITLKNVLVKSYSAMALIKEAQ